MNVLVKPGRMDGFVLSVMSKSRRDLVCVTNVCPPGKECESDFVNV